jgi:hypothetical protein
LSWRRKCLEIREKLAASDPANIQWQRDLSVNYEKIGIVQSLQGDQDNAYRYEMVRRSKPASVIFSRDALFTRNT